MGILAFGVALPHSPVTLVGIAAGGLLIVAGVSGLSHSAMAKVFYEQNLDNTSGDQAVPSDTRDHGC